MDNYMPVEIRNREPMEIIELDSQHAPEDSILFIYYIKTQSDLTETAPPTDEEVNFIRRFAPRETVPRQLMMELAISTFMKKAAARNKA